MNGFNWLGGQLRIERGSKADYTELERFHYLGGAPAVWAGVWVVRFRTEDSGLRTEREKRAPSLGTDLSVLSPQSSALSPSRVIAVGVLSFPTARCKVREKRLGIELNGRYGHMKWLNENLRTISRVIVHPQFRAIGMASRLVRRMCEESPTRYVESIAAMGRVHPFFEKAGMEKIECGEKGYFLWDRGEVQNSERGMQNEIQLPHS